MNNSKHLVILAAACGVGKTTVKNALIERKLLPGYACLDTDEVGINWWDYAGTDREGDFSGDCLNEALRLAGDKHLLFTTCMNPMDFYARIRLPAEVVSTRYISMTCSDDEVRRRLLARPPERMCGDEAFIAAQIAYNHWFRDNAGKFQLYVDNTGMTVYETAELMAAFVLG